MIQKVNVTKITGRNTKKDGTALVNKFGKPYFIIGLQCTQHGQTWINGFESTIPQWEGKEIELDIFEEEYNGTKSLKFKVPKAEEKTSGELKSMLLDIQLRLGSISSKVSYLFDIASKNRTSNGAPMPDFSSVQLPPEQLKRAALANPSSLEPTLEDEQAMNDAFDSLPM